MANTKGKNDQIKRKATDIRSIYIRSPKVPAQIIETSKVAFVFSCPGRKEQEANQVCYGATGNSMSFAWERKLFMPQTKPGSMLKSLKGSISVLCT